MPKKVISLGFIYSRETKNYHVYDLAGEYEFFPKHIHISKKDVEKPVKKVTMNLIIQED